MLGAIIGDVAGSYLEVLEVKDLKIKGKRDYVDRIKILDKRFPLFNNNCSVTDDSILTIAILDAILNKKPYQDKLKEYGLREINLGVDKYGRSRFGSGFINWLNGNSSGNSYGNGSAMRISPVGFLYDSLEDVKQESYFATVPTHNNEDSIKCAEAVSTSIFLLRHGLSKVELIDYIKNNYFKLDYSLEELRHNYRFTSKAINSVPQAIYAFIKSDSFESTVRNALSIGGDTDTIACIATSLAEAHYGIDKDIFKQVLPFIPDYMLKILSKYYTEIDKRNEVKVLCKK